MERRREVCEWEGRVCACEEIGAPSMLRLIRKARMLSTLRFELGVKSSAAEVELVLVVFIVLRKLISSCSNSTPEAAKKWTGSL